MTALELLREKLPQFNDRQRILLFLRYFCKFDDALNAIAMGITRGEVSQMNKSISSLLDKRDLIKLFNQMDRRSEFQKQIDLRSMDVRTNGGRRETNQDKCPSSNVEIQKSSSLGTGLDANRSINDIRKLGEKSSS